VIFDKRPGLAEVDVVERAQEFLDDKIESGELIIPAGVNFKFTGSYENQVRSEQRLKIVMPVAIFIIFMILYFQFKGVPITLMVFSGIFVAWAGGFILLWLYGQSWFLDFSLFGTSMRTLFQIHPINLSVAVWVGFLALFGIATDNGVIMGTYLEQTFRDQEPGSVARIHAAVLEAAERRIRPALMTTATTILALIPILTSTGRGSDIMVPMALPSFGGMCVAIVSLFIVPVLYSIMQEARLGKLNPPMLPAGGKAS
jgi:Cu(I)/Ag(I) efflux system membrane protein CusA/SilA